MTLVRLLLLFAISGILVIFTLSNWAVPMQLVFLGIRSPALPLSLWVLGAIAAGILTTLTINALFGLARFSARRSERRTQARSTAKSTAAAQEPYAGYAYTPPSSFSRTPEPSRSPRSSEGDDWEEDASDWFDEGGDDWTEESSRSRRTDYEARQTPTSGSRSGSTYSYSYGEPKPPSQPEPVVDADYRVIIPPQRNLEDDDESGDRSR